MPLRAPPWARYKSVEAGIASIQAYAKAQGYALRKCGNKYDKRTPPQVRKVFL
ncbi:uncharacterized protein BDZ99DRAFT_468706, partial [Mytilinidion resinicola]